MHELSVLEALLDRVRAHVPSGKRLRDVHVEIGALQHLDVEILSLTWSALTDGTEFAGAGLMIEQAPVLIRCLACRNEYEPNDLGWVSCPECGAARPELLTGGNVLLKSIDVEPFPIGPAAEGGW